MSSYLPPRLLFGGQYLPNSDRLGEGIDLKHNSIGASFRTTAQNTSHQNDIQRLFSDNFKRYSDDIEAGLDSGKYSSKNSDFLGTIRSLPASPSTPGRVVERKTRRILKGDNFYVDLTTTNFTESVHVVAVNNLGGRDLDLKYMKNQDGTMWVSKLENGIDVTLPVGFSESELNFSMVILWLIKMQFAKTAMSAQVNSINRPKVNSQRKSAGEIVQRSRVCDPKEGVHRLSHDLQCTIPTALAVLLGLVSISIPLNGKFGVWVPTLGVQWVDVFECCRAHDVALWCSNSRDSTLRRSARSADFDVVGCFFAKLKDVFTRGGFFEDIFNLSYFTVVYGWVFSLAALGSQLSGYAHDESLLNLDHRNDGSCLCGGNNPTVLCDDQCRDLCREMGKSQNCGDCSWACDYDKETGIARGYKLLPPKNGRPCCPGTEARCLPWPSLTLKENCRDRAKECYDCKWVCDGCSKYDPKFCLNPGVYTPVLEKADDVDCCKGTPRPQQKPGPDWCTAAPRDPDIRGPIVLIPG